MKRIVLIVLLTLGSLISHSQGAIVPGGVSVANYNKPPIFLRELFLNGVTPKLYSDINGTPFLFDNFLLAKVTFFDGRTADSVLVKLNVYDNRIHFISESMEELQISIPVNEILIIDQNPQWSGNRYRSNVPGAGQGIFQVMVDGKNVQLLKKVMMKVWETRSLGDQQKKNFQYEQELYFGTSSGVALESKKCGAVISLLPEKFHAEATAFVSSNNIRCNKEEEMKKLIEFCNGL